MQHTLERNHLEHWFTPRWTWRSVVLAGTVSLSVYLLLPYLETLTSPPKKTSVVQSVTTATLPPPPPPPPRVEKRPVEAKPKTPKPEMEQLRRSLAPLHAAMNLSMAMGDIGGDFGVNFGVSAETLEGQINELVFEIADLDEPPRPLARLQPAYPPQARMRRIEGFVVVEFVVAPDGTTREVTVMSSQPADVFDGAAVRAVQSWRFKPGVKAGKMVAARVRQRVGFRLD